MFGGVFAYPKKLNGVEIYRRLLYNYCTADKEVVCVLKKLFIVITIFCMISSLFGCASSTKRYSSSRTEQEALHDYVNYLNSKKCELCGWAFKGEGLICGNCRSKYPEVAERFDSLLE